MNNIKIDALTGVTQIVNYTNIININSNFEIINGSIFLIFSSGIVCAFLQFDIAASSLVIASGITTNGRIGTIKANYKCKNSSWSKEVETNRYDFHFNMVVGENMTMYLNNITSSPITLNKFDVIKVSEPVVWSYSEMI